MSTDTLPYPAATSTTTFVFVSKAEVHALARRLNREANRARYNEAAKAITLRVIR